jgi:Uma2 family endonuclease
MNIQAAKTGWLPTTPDEFLRWNEGREGKREFVNGNVVEVMVNTTASHARLAARMLMQIGAQLDPLRFAITSAGFAVRTPTGIRFPDLMIEPMGGNGKALATASPLFLAEVLSPSTMANDFGPKMAEYTALDTLRHYLIVSQDEPRVWLWSRGEDGAWSGPDIHEAGTVELGGLGAALDLSAIYAGIA